MVKYLLLGLVLLTGYSCIFVNDKILWEDGNPVGANEKILYDSESEDFIVFEFQAGSYEILAVDSVVL